MHEWRNIALNVHQTIRDAMEIIGKGSLGVAIVSNANDELLGVITDGDIRRGLLRSYGLNDTVDKVMNSNPVYCFESDSTKKKIAILNKLKIVHLPVLNSSKKIVGIEVIKSVLNKNIENSAFIIAGGLGTRLRPLTEKVPKPLLNLGGKPILQIILESLIDAGISKFYFSVNYMGNMIVDYFGNGEKWGVEIKYISEEQPLGTAGSLSLLQDKIEHPLLVMNADLLTKIDVVELLNFHTKQNAKATMCVREYDFQVPYGVVQTDEHSLIDITEKPVHKFFVNAGIYVLDPQVISIIPKAQYYTMPELLKKVNEDNTSVKVFPIHEYWLDIGQLEDFKKAQFEVSKVIR
jgi:dTDP-glucose pyrophosphorylase